MEKTVPTETEICFRGDKSFLQAAARNELPLVKAYPETAAMKDSIEVSLP